MRPLTPRIKWLRGLDLNQRPLGYERKSGSDSHQEDPTEPNERSDLRRRVVGPFRSVSVALLHSLFIGWGPSLPTAAKRHSREFFLQAFALDRIRGFGQSTHDREEPLPIGLIRHSHSFILTRGRTSMELAASKRLGRFLVSRPMSVPGNGQQPRRLRTHRAGRCRRSELPAERSRHKAP